MQTGDNDQTPLEEMGLKGALLEKLLSSHIFTAGELQRWLRSEQKIEGIGREQKAKLSDLLVDHQLKKK